MKKSAPKNSLTSNAHKHRSITSWQTIMIVMMVIVKVITCECLHQSLMWCVFASRIAPLEILSACFFSGFALLKIGCAGARRL